MLWRRVKYWYRVAISVPHIRVNLLSFLKPDRKHELKRLYSSIAALPFKHVLDSLAALSVGPIYRLK